MDKPYALFISSKWLDQDEERGISNAEHYLWGTYPYESDVFHFDEYRKVNGKPGDKALLERIDKRKPDIIILDYHLDSELNPTDETLREISHNRRIPVIAVWWDHVWEFHLQEADRIGNYIDLNVVVDSSAFFNKVREPERHIFLWTPQSDMYYPEEKTIPVGFYGRLKKVGRKEAIEALSKIKGFKHDGGRKEKPLTKEQYAELYRKTGIVINFSEGRTAYSQLVGRVIEATQSGCLLMEQANPETKGMFIPGKEYVEWDGVEDLVEKVEYYLAHPGEREKIALCGHSKCQKRYSAERWWRIVFDSLDQRLNLNPDYEAELSTLIAKYGVIAKFHYESPPEGAGPLIYGKIYFMRKIYEGLVAGEDIDLQEMGFKTKVDATKKDAPIFLRELICLHLEIRDVKYAVKYIGKYIQNEYPGFEQMRQFFIEMDAISERMTRTLKRRKYQDYAMIVVDSLRQKDVQDMPILSDIKKDSFSFTNAISPSFYTRPCFKGFFEGTLLSEQTGKHFESKLEKSELLRYLKDNDFKVINLSTFKFLPDSVADYPLTLSRDRCDQLGDFKPHESIKYTTSHQFWLYLCEICNNPPQNTFTVMLLEEYHIPCTGGWHSEKLKMIQRANHYKGDKEPIEDMERQRAETLTYIDEQFDVLFGMFPEVKAVIMADHGQMLDDEHIGSTFIPCKENVHVPLIFYGNGKGEFTGLYGLIDLSKEWIDFIQGNKLNPGERKIVESQRDAIFDEKYTKDPEFRKGLGEKYMQGFKMFTGEESYVEYDDGTREAV